MQDGDISNAVAPRFIIVFEGLIGRFSDGAAERSESYLRRLRQWKRAAECWEIDPQVVAHMWDMILRFDVQVDTATYLPPKYAEHIEKRLEQANVPSGHFHVTSPEQLTKSLAYMPYVRKVFYRIPERLFVYGDRGVYVEGAFNPWT